MIELSLYLVRFVMITRKRKISSLFEANVFNYSQYLSSFAHEKDHDLSILIQGMEEFMRIANFSSRERMAFYGNKLAGFHYRNDYVALYNEDKDENEQIKIGSQAYHSLPFHAPYLWTIGTSQRTLNYVGTDLAGALDQLLLGPTIIECGMFCKLSILFGIRYMLGNLLFNQLFCHDTFDLSAMFHDENTSATNNPLPQFFEMENDSTIQNGVGISYVENDRFYSLKHPGGSSVGYNAVTIHNKHTIFKPGFGKKANLSVEDILEILRQDLNAAQDEDDEAQIKLYKTQNPFGQHQNLQTTFFQLITVYPKLSRYTLSQKKFESELEKSSHQRPALRFDFEKFKSWVSSEKHQHAPTLETY